MSSFPGLKSSLRDMKTAPNPPPPQFFGLLFNEAVSIDTSWHRQPKLRHRHIFKYLILNNDNG
jgi:hypothetical protein